MQLDHPGNIYKPGSISEHCTQCDQQLAETGQSTPQAKVFANHPFTKCMPGTLQLPVIQVYSTAACDTTVQQNGTQHEHASHLVGV